jgi:hypothetical protein
MNAADVAATLQLIKDAQANPVQDPVSKAWTQSGSAITGITEYDLEAPAKKLYPVITPLRNMIPRVSGKGGIQANWRAITGINTTGLSAGVSGGNRGGAITTTTANYIAAYAGIGLEDFATYEAEYAAQGFDDVKALAVDGLLKALMIQEERIILGGNSALAMGTTPTPTCAGFATGGTLPNQTESVICVALTLEGYLNSSVAGGIPGQVSRTNTDSSVDVYGGGAAQKSGNGTAATGGAAGSVTAIVTPVLNASGYAWFWGLAGAEVLGAITTNNSILITAAATGTQTAASLTAADYSINNLVFNGLLTMCCQGLGSYRAVQATGTAGVGTPLTADGAGGIVEIDAALKSFWDNYRLSPDTIWVNSQEMTNIGKKILNGGGVTSAQRFTFNSEQGILAGGIMVRNYLNKYSMSGMIEIAVKLHPNIPPGTILFTTSQLPYPMSNVSNVFQVRARREYYQIQWPFRSRKYEYGVYADEVLQHFFPASMGIITNIANG